jgi:hypothetical protein
VGQVRATHDDFVASVTSVLVGEHGLDPQAGRLLRSLVERRHHADDEPEAVSVDEARRTVGYATYVVEAVAKWLKSPAKA